MTITEIKATLDVLDRMIDTLYRRLIPTENLLGGVSEAYEKMSAEEKEEYKTMREQHSNLLAYRKDILNQAMDAMPGLTKVDGFQF